MRPKYLIGLIVVGIYLYSTIGIADENKNDNGFLNISLNNNTPLLYDAKSIEVAIVKVDNNLENIFWKNNVSLPFDMSFSPDPGVYKIYVKKDISTVIEFNNDSTGYKIDYKNNVDIPRKEDVTVKYANTFLKDVLSDIPWRINVGENIPITYIIKDANEWSAYFRTITIYDDNINILVYTHPIYQTISQDIWYSHDILSPSIFYKQDGYIKTHIKFDIDWEFDVHNYYTTYISPYNLPKFDNWHYGDTHYHSIYTDNVAEFGAPIQSTELAGKAIGLEWITVTDHSFDLDTTRWNNLINDSNYYSTDSFRVLPSEEISCTVPSFPQQYNHYLSYGITQFIPGGEWEDDTGSHYNCSDLVSIVNNQNGFGYVAHPMDDDPFRDPWRDYTLDFKGLEIWNGGNLPNEGLSKWKELLLNGRKIFVEAGSDAHGDFNSGLGKSRTLVHSATFDNNGILSALKDGHSIMTNGPTVIFDIGGTNIGDTRDMSRGRINLNVQWNSTPEFGTVKNIAIIKGIIGDREVVEKQIYPNSYSGSERITITSSQNVYYRLEGISTNGNKVYTNPIWINIVDTIPSEQWNKTFGGKNADIISYGQQTSDGGYILIGETSSYGNGDYDAWLVKTDSKGKERWNKTFGKISYDNFESGQQTKDGGYILGGNINKNGVLIKTDNKGNNIWNITFERNGDEFSVNVFAVQQTSDNGYIIGLSKTIGMAYMNISIIKLDHNRRQIWSRNLGNYYRSRIDAIQQTADGSYIILGDSYYEESFLIKVDVNGNELWNKTLPGINALSIDQTIDGSFILAGYDKIYSPSGGTIVWIGKTDKNGDMWWNKTLSKGCINSVKVISGDSYILAGDNNNGDGLLTKTNSNGDEIWNMTIGGIGSDYIKSVQQISDGYILTGVTNSYGAGDYDAWLVKLFGK